MLVRGLICCGDTCRGCAGWALLPRRRQLHTGHRVEPSGMLEPQFAQNIVPRFFGNHSVFSIVAEVMPWASSGFAQRRYPMRSHGSCGGVACVYGRVASPCRGRRAPTEAMAGLNAALEMAHRLHKNGSELLGYVGVYKSGYQSLRCTRLTLGGLGRFV